MQKQTTLYIPKPCHENWDKMTPTQQGKFCSSCNKQVVDFSLMSDNQILNFLSHQSGKLCGRFDTEQLERPLIETKIKKKKSWWMALAMPLLFLFDRSEAQDNKVVGDTKYAVFPKKDVTEVLVGKVAICDPAKSPSLIDTAIDVSNEITINGKVVDENNNPLSYVRIIEKGTQNTTITDTLGNFSLEINSDKDSLVLDASYAGFESLEKVVSTSENDIVITMKLQPIILGEIAVINQSLTGTVGGLVICRKVTKTEKLNAAIKKTFNTTSFKIYPNPVIKGNMLNLELSIPGEYRVQLFDNKSRLIQTEQINTVSETMTVTFPVTANTAPGVYYLRLIDEKKKKSFTEKLIIQ